MTLLAKLKLVPAVVALGLLLLGAAGWGGRRDEAAAAPVPKADKDEGLIWTLDGKTGTLTAFAPDGTKKQDVVLKSLRNFKGFTRDGESLLFLAKKGELSDAEDGLTLHIGTPGDLTKATDTGIEWNANDSCTYMLTRDRKRVVLERIVRALGNALPVMPTSPSFTHTVVDLATKKETELSLPGHSQLWSESPDGKDWIVMAYNNGPKLPGYCYMRVPVAGGKPVPICETHQFPFLMPSPDGKLYLGIGIPFPVKEGVKGFNLYHFDPANGKVTELEQFADFDQRNHRWSPDGKRYAMKKHGDADVFAADIDGTNRKKLFAVPDAGPESFLIGWFPAKPRPTAPLKRNAPIPKEGPDPGLIWTHSHKTGKLVAYTPDGKTAKGLVLPDGHHFIGFTPDGTRILFAGKNGKVADADATDGLTLHIRDITEKAVGTDTGLGYKPNDQFVVSPDGKWAVRMRRTNVGPPGGAWQKQRPEYAHILFDVAAKEETKIDLPTDCQVMQWTPDGKAWLVLHHNNGADPKLPAWRWLTTPADDKPDLKPICDAGSFNWLEPAADGKALLGAGVVHPAGEAAQCLFRVTGGKATVLTPFDGVAFVNVRRSPDGKRIACMKYDWDSVKGQPGDTHLLLLDSDGKNETTLFTNTTDHQSVTLLGWFPTKPPAAEPDPRKKNAPVPKAEAKPGVVMHLSGYGLGTRLYDGASGKLLLTLKDTAPGFKRSDARLSPDGKRVAMLGQVMVVTPPGVPAPPRPPENGDQKLYMVDVAGDGSLGDPVAEGLNVGRFAWAPDGESLYFAETGAEANRMGAQQPTEFTFHRIDAKAGKKSAIPKLDGYSPVDVSPDGKTLLASKFGPPKLPGRRLSRADFLIDLKTFEAIPFGDGSARPCQFHPAGDRLIVARPADPKKEPDLGDPESFFVFDSATKNETPVPLPAEATAASARVYHALPSRDGTRWLFVWGENLSPPENEPKPFSLQATRFTTADETGRNGKIICRQPTPGREDQIQGHFFKVDHR